jgi:hypothetical protein
MRDVNPLPRTNIIPPSPSRAHATPDPFTGPMLLNQTPPKQRAKTHIFPDEYNGSSGFVARKSSKPPTRTANNPTAGITVLNQANIPRLEAAKNPQMTGSKRKAETDAEIMDRILETDQRTLDKELAKSMAAFDELEAANKVVTTKKSPLPLVTSPKSKLEISAQSAVATLPRKSSKKRKPNVALKKPPPGNASKRDAEIEPIPYNPNPQITSTGYTRGPYTKNISQSESKKRHREAQKRLGVKRSAERQDDPVADAKWKSEEKAKNALSQSRLQAKWAANPGSKEAAAAKANAQRKSRRKTQREDAKAAAFKRDADIEPIPYNPNPQITATGSSAGQRPRLVLKKPPANAEVERQGASGMKRLQL